MQSASANSLLRTHSKQTVCADTEFLWCIRKQICVHAVGRLRAPDDIDCNVVFASAAAAAHGRSACRRRRRRRLTTLSLKGKRLSPLTLHVALHLLLARPLRPFGISLSLKQYTARCYASCQRATARLWYVELHIFQIENKSEVRTHDVRTLTEAAICKTTLKENKVAPFIVVYVESAIDLSSHTYSR